MGQMDMPSLSFLVIPTNVYYFTLDDQANKPKKRLKHDQGHIWPTEICIIGVLHFSIFDELDNFFVTRNFCHMLKKV